MKSYFDLHRSAEGFCKQATLAVTVAGGMLTCGRVSWYPGHPLLHLYKVGKWPVAALVALHLQSLHRMLDLANAFLPALLLHSYKQPAEVNDLVIALLVQETHADLLWVF